MKLAVAISLSGLLSAVPTLDVQNPKDATGASPPRQAALDLCKADPSHIDGLLIKPDPELRYVDLKTLFEDKVPRAKNGVKLRITASQVTDGKTDLIRVNWSLSYNGPRPPLTILRPCLTTCLKHGATSLMVYAVGKTGDEHMVIFRSRRIVDYFPVPTAKECFLSVKPGTPATGSLEVETEQLRRYLMAEAPDDYEKDTPPKTYVRLVHAPEDRGEAHNLDAWTGEVNSNIVPLKLSKW